MSASPPVTFVVLGGTGDLARRKLLPALARLVARGALHPATRVVGVSRDRALGEAGYRALVRAALAAAGVDPAGLASWIERCVHFAAVGEDPAEYANLAAALPKFEDGAPCGRVLYLALPPRAVPVAIEGLGAAGLARAAPWTRLVVEKPFGRDRASARELAARIHRYFDESQVFRIDHYLGKETVQNLLVLRFANAIFEALWNRRHVRCVQITAAEPIGVEGRGATYEELGAVRDMVQSHLLQVLALVALEPPVPFDPEPLRDERAKVLRAVRPPGPADVVLGQYGRGVVDGRAVPGYREEPGVDPRSRTETYAALRLEVDTWRWRGVPFFLRTGKRLPRKLTQVTILFEDVPFAYFACAAGRPGVRCEPGANALFLTLDPEEGVCLAFEAKVPGAGFATTTEHLELVYRERFGPVPEAYETLLLDVVEGDPMLFARADEVDAAWAACEPLLARGLPVRSYAAGTWGPEAAEELVRREGLAWLLHEPAAGTGGGT